MPNILNLRKFRFFLIIIFALTSCKGLENLPGGDARKNVSVNLIKAIDEAKKRKMKIFGVVGKKNGYLNKKGDIVILIPINEKSQRRVQRFSANFIDWLTNFGDIFSE